MPRRRVCLGSGLRAAPQWPHCSVCPPHFASSLTEWTQARMGIGWYRSLSSLGPSWLLVLVRETSASTNVLFERLVSDEFSSKLLECLEEQTEINKAATALILGVAWNDEKPSIPASCVFPWSDCACIVMCYRSSLCRNPQT